MHDIESIADIVIRNMGPTGVWGSRREHLVIELGRVYATGWRDGALYAGLLLVGLLAAGALLFVSLTV